MKKIWSTLLSTLFIPLTTISCTGEYEPVYYEKYKFSWPFEIIDGDTIKVYNGNNLQSIRFFGIDTPETLKDNNKNFLAPLENYYAQKAKDYVIDLVKHKSIRIIFLGKDKYKRWISKILCESKDVAKELLKKGLARVKYISTYQNKDYFWVNDSRLISYYHELLKIQNEAQEKNIGLWKENINNVFHKK